jgi:hypothetical protein
MRGVEGGGCGGRKVVEWVVGECGVTIVGTSPYEIPFFGFLTSQIRRNTSLRLVPGMT